MFASCFAAVASSLEIRGYGSQLIDPTERSRAPIIALTAESIRGDLTLRSATQTVHDYANEHRPNLWPTRPDKGGSALGRDQLAPVFEETGDSFAQSLERLHPNPLTVPPPNADTADGYFAHEWIETYSPYFAERKRKRLAAVVSGRGLERVPYDQMAAAYASVTRLVAPVQLGMALTASPARVALLAFESVVLVRKPLGGSNQPHCHAGRDKCGCSLNALALVAHLCVDGEHRCAGLGTRPLPATVAIERSVARALLSLLADVELAAQLLAGDGGAQLATCPVVSGLLPAGGPRGRGPHKQTDVELVTGRTWNMVRAISARRDPRLWGPRPFALAIPTTGVATSGPRRVAPSALSAIDPGWPAQPESLAAEVAAVEACAPAEEPRPEDPERWSREVRAPGGPGTAWQVPARLAGPQSHAGVALLGRKAPEADRATVWVSHPGLCEEAVPAIDALLASREIVVHGPRLASSPFEYWIQRGYRRHAAVDLILKGSASKQLREGVGGAMAGGFLDYVLRAVPLTRVEAALDRRPTAR